jgi:TorA maturation chaperone TorD
VIDAAESPFYREMAQLTRSFIEFEKQELARPNSNTV